MKSPITGKEMELVKEKRKLVFRKETFEVVYHYYICKDSKEQYTSTELDELNMNQVYNQYRDAYNIPFPDEIVRIRKKYNLSASRMSEILGLGINSYRQYEAGEMPSISNARLIQMADDPRKFAEMITLCDSLDEKAKARSRSITQTLIEEQTRNMFDFNIIDYLLGSHLADIYSGYRNPDFDKFTEMVVFFSEKIEPFKTKMNKLLFYADFLMFRKSCFSISGVRYKAINMGPVPNNFNSIFEYLVNTGKIEILYTQFPKGYIGEQCKTKNGRSFKEDIFTEKELDVLYTVADKFKNTTTSDMISISHKEEAWKQNEKNKNEISYQYAFDLSQI